MFSDPVLTDPPEVLRRYRLEGGLLIRTLISSGASPSAGVP